jgi:uroporphyrinogen-III synthase
MPDALDLTGVAVLVTRPEPQASELEGLVARHGGSAVLLPLIDIQPVASDAKLRRLLARIGDYDIVIFISRNAVERGLAMLRETDAEIPARASIAAIGESTAGALEQAGFSGVVRPQGKSNSEELLKCDLLKDVAGRRVLIFRGQDGRELLAETLRERGAFVDYAQVYRRTAVDTDAEPALRRWLDSPSPVLVLTSEASARAMLDRIPAAIGARVFGAPLAVISERLRQFCRDAGWHGPIGVCASASDEALLATVHDISHGHNETGS